MFSETRAHGNSKNEISKQSKKVRTDERVWKEVTQVQKKSRRPVTRGPANNETLGTGTAATLPTSTIIITLSKYNNNHNMVVFYKI